MSKASKIMETMFSGENAAPVKPVRKTQFIRQDDGSTIRRVL